MSAPREHRKAQEIPGRISPANLGEHIISQDTPGNRKARQSPGGHQTIRASRTPIMAIHAKLLSIQALQDAWANINGAWATDG